VSYSKDPEQDYFADGVTEALITRLAQVQALRVISRTSAMAYKGARKPLRQIAGELGVDAVVEGSVMRSGDRVRITAQLIASATDEHLWADQYDRELKDVLALQDEVAGDIVRQIRVRLSPVERSRLSSHRAVNPEAYELYLRGRFHLHRLGREDLLRAVDLFREACALDSTDARPYSGSADAYTLLTSVVGAIPPREGWPRVREFARKALARDPDLAEAHTSMGAMLWLGDWNWAGAERELRRALELNPGYAVAREALGLLLVAEGRTDEGLAAIRRASALDPLSLLTGSNALYAYYYTRRWDDAIAEAERLLRIEPRFSRAHTVLRHLYEAKGDYAAALRHHEQRLVLEGHGGEMIGRLRAGFARGGTRGYWEVERALAREQGHDETYPLWAAAPEAQLGHRDEALRLIARAIEVRQTDVVFVGSEPLFDSLRGDPRFAAILKSVGLRP